MPFPRSLAVKRAAATAGTALSLKTLTALATVSPRFPPILICPAVGVPDVKVKSVPARLIVALFAGWAENRMLPVAASPAVVVATPSSSFSQKPKFRAHIGTTTSP
ncbi:hypothetical protein D3C72_1198170 [compost metagenome]